MSGELLTKSKIADALGTNPMRVTRFIERNKINAVKKEEDSSSNEMPRTHWWQRFGKH